VGATLGLAHQKHARLSGEQQTSAPRGDIAGFWRHRGSIRKEQTSTITIQDHAILTISCMTLAGYANGSVGFASRQFAIGDVYYIDFGQFRGGHVVVANETSKVNMHSPGIYGDASRFAAAYRKSLSAARSRWATG